MSAIGWVVMKTAIVEWVRKGSGVAADRILFSGQNLARPPGDGAWISLRWTSVQVVGSDWVDVEARPLVLADLAFTATVPGVLTTSAPHDLHDGDGPVRLETSGVLPAGYSTIADYWVVGLSPTTLGLATSFAAAQAGTYASISSVGTGAHAIVSTADTVRAGAEVTQLARGQRRGELSITAWPPAEADDATEAHAILLDVTAALGLPSVSEAIVAAGFAVANIGTIAPLDGVLNSTRFEPRAIMPAVLFFKSEISESGAFFDAFGVEDTERGTTIVV